MQVSIHLHVTFCGESTVIYGLRWHPLYRKFIVFACCTIHVLFERISRQTKIGNLDKFVVAYQDIASGEVPMNNAFSW